MRRVYVLLVGLHPRQFRQRHSEEMLWIYDESVRGERARLFADAIVSVLRQRLLRESENSFSSGPYNRAEGPLFATISSQRLPLAAVWQGSATAALVWFAVSLLVTVGGSSGNSRLEFAGVHSLVDSRVTLPPIPIRAGKVALPPPPARPAGDHPRRVLEPETERAAPTFWTRALAAFGLAPSMEAATSFDSREIEASHRQMLLDMARSESSGSQRAVLVMPPLPVGGLSFDLVFNRLDRNWDGRLTPEEIDDAGMMLRSLDEDRDGRVTAAECGLMRVAGEDERRQAGIFGLLDQDGDGELSDAEMAIAPAKLRRLADGGKGSITRRAMERAH